MLKTIEEITPGMIVASDVMVNGLTLVRAGVELTPEHIQALLKWKVDHVELEGEDIGDTVQDNDEIDQDKYDRQAARIEALFTAVTKDEQLSQLKECLLQAYRELCRVE